MPVSGVEGIASFSRSHNPPAAVVAQLRCLLLAIAYLLRGPNERRLDAISLMLIQVGCTHGLCVRFAGLRLSITLEL